MQSSLKGTQMSKKRLPGFMSIPDAGNVLGISRNAAYAAASRYRETGGVEGLPNITIGGSYRVPEDVLRRMAELRLPGDAA